MVLLHCNKQMFILNGGVNMNEAYMICCYNELDAEFGYDCGPMVIESNCTKAYAKCYCRHMNKITPDFITYFVQPEPDRYW